MSFFNLFLPVLAFLLSMVSIAVLYWILSRCEENAFIPTYYFLGFSSASVALLALSRTMKVLYGADLFNFVLIQDLLISYIALFVFGALWQSYEAEIVTPPSWIREE